jgi:lipopolysaccharide transport system ATP-binding protein
VPDIAIKVSNLSKRYRIGLKEEIHDTFVSSVTAWLKSPISNYRKIHNLSKFSDNVESDDIILALKDVSFDVKCGEVLGIIGKNGAGKSTLLKVLCRITEPTSGRAVVNGRVASLLEVGTGFHPELTGRENLYLNGVILGMIKREIDQKFDEIVDFSGVEKFIDTPVKRYSSGMRVRLAFSVAAHLEPEILLIDEVLAVGDIDFQDKCIKKMDSLSHSGGRTVLLVSHNMSSIARLCDRVILFDEGRIVTSGEPSEVLTDYYNRMGLNKSRITYTNTDHKKAVQIRKIDLLDHKGMSSAIFDRAHPFRVRIEYVVREPTKYLGVIFSLHAMGNVQICKSVNLDNEQYNDGTYDSGNYVSIVEFPGSLLNYGRYSFDIVLRAARSTMDRSKGIGITLQDSNLLPSTVRTPKYSDKIILSMPMNWETVKL